MISKIPKVRVSHFHIDLLFFLEGRGLYKSKIFPLKPNLKPNLRKSTKTISLKFGLCIYCSFEISPSKIQAILPVGSGETSF